MSKTLDGFIQDALNQGNTSKQILKAFENYITKHEKYLEETEECPKCKKNLNPDSFCENCKDYRDNLGD